MIVHIVMFQFRSEGKNDNIAKTRTMLEALTQKIAPLRSMEVGVNIVESDRAFDLVLTSTFDDMEGLDIYRVHPAHLEVVAFIKEVTETSKVVDYEK